MVLSFTLNIEGLAPIAGEEVLERDRGGPGDAGACGLYGLMWDPESSDDTSPDGLCFCWGGKGELSCPSLGFLSDSVEVMA